MNLLSFKNGKDGKLICFVDVNGKLTELKHNDNKIVILGSQFINQVEVGKAYYCKMIPAKNGSSFVAINPILRSDVEKMADIFDVFFTTSEVEINPQCYKIELCCDIIYSDVKVGSDDISVPNRVIKFDITSPESLNKILSNLDKYENVFKGHLESLEEELNHIKDTIEN